MTHAGMTAAKVRISASITDYELTHGNLNIEPKNDHEMGAIKVKQITFYFSIFNTKLLIIIISGKLLSHY